MGNEDTRTHFVSVGVRKTILGLFKEIEVCKTLAGTLLLISIYRADSAIFFYGPPHSHNVPL